MTFHWYDWAGYIGVLLVLLAYFLLQARKLHGNKLVYQLMNILGAFGVLLSLTVLAVVLGAVFKFTRIGLAMQAAAMERGNSPFVGIDVEKMLMLGWGLASVFGFIAGVLAAPSLFLSPVMMFSVVIYSLAAASLGGWDSPAGAIIGGLLLGVAESVGTTFVSAIGAELRLAIPFLLMIVVLAVRPQGIFGRSIVARV